ncbi:MAG: hypothetical protein JXA57_18900, partial [Armatimonadetes bacterium]|nr:hypothetical protein [Armatimonadota bacterium]
MKVRHSRVVHPRPLVGHMHIGELGGRHLSRQIEFIDLSENGQVRFVRLLLVAVLADAVVDQDRD